jgi:cyclopropane-fatty-acyl-phospholipid synthase
MIWTSGSTGSFSIATMQYSCAYFERPDASIDEAQWAKKRHIAAKLDLQPRPGGARHRLRLGWAGLFLAENTGVSVTGRDAFDRAAPGVERRRAASGIADRARFELRDYRSLDRKFDRIVSVGMFEHVGATRYDEFSARRKAAEAGRVMLLIRSAVGTAGRHESVDTPNTSSPGGYIPALSEVLQSMERVGLYLGDIEILRMHYAEPARHGGSGSAPGGRTQQALRPRFCRMWDFYLGASEATFRAGGYMVFQNPVHEDQGVLPLTRITC